jgi:hypothetical protein
MTESDSSGKSIELDRSKLTFEQAEGVEPLPSPLAAREISPQLRALLWNVLHDSLKQDETYDPTGYSGASHIEDNWERVLKDWHVQRLHQMVDEFDHKFASQEAKVKRIIQKGNYLEIFGLLEFVIRHGSCPYRLAGGIEWALRKSRAAYTVTDRGKTIAPLSNEGEARIVQKTFADLSHSEFGGALSHLREAARLLNEGSDAESIRESIHAVVSVARLLDPDASTMLSPALKRLEKEGVVHPVIRQGFEKIYGYTNAEQGIRHEILDKPGDVDSTDAQFMFGACSAFVSYLIGKARKAKIDIE